MRLVQGLPLRARSRWEGRSQRQRPRAGGRVFGSQPPLPLQLMARRAMAQRAVVQAAESDEGSNVVATSKAHADTAPSPCWRLVPDDAAIYEWQWECLPLLWTRRYLGVIISPVTRHWSQGS